MSNKNGHSYIFKQSSLQSSFNLNGGSKNGTPPSKKDTHQEKTNACLNPKDELKILKNWGLLKKNVITGHIIDPLIEKGVYTPEQWMDLKSKRATPSEQIEELLYHILKSKSDTYEVFIGALKSRGYAHVANQLEGVKSEDTSPSVSTYGSGNSNLGRKVGRPPTNGSTFPVQISSSATLSDQRSGGGGTSHVVSKGGTSGENAVTQDDLMRVKEDITDELRRLRVNIENDRDQDRLELLLVQRKHTELNDDLTKATQERETLVRELSVITATVKKLTEQMEAKDNEYTELRNINKDMKHQLENKTGDLQKQLSEKEQENKVLSRDLHNKEAKYKNLQSTMETVKVEHEERLTRLKTLNKDKVKLEKEMQLLQKEKKNLEVKIKSLEQHIRILQESHARETGDYRLQLERQRTLLEEKEKERLDTERKLEESVRENENLKQKNLRLEDNLHKNMDEKKHLQEKIQSSELSKYAIPPFLAGTKTNRPTGWRTKRSSNWQ